MVSKFWAQSEAQVYDYSAPFPLCARDVPSAGTEIASLILLVASPINLASIIASNAP